MQFADAAKVIGVVITLSPSLTPKANAHKCKAAVPLATATEYFAPIYFENASSKFLICGPWVKKSDFKVCTTA